jgi:hypothetical protein
MNRHITSLATLLLVSCVPVRDLSPQGVSTSSSTVDAAERKRRIEQLADAMTEMYLDPATGLRLNFASPTQAR